MRAWRDDIQSAVTIGNFDGLHLGHQTLLDAVLKRAKIANLDAVVVTFDPHPGNFFASNRRIHQVQTLDDRLALMEDKGIDSTLVLKFDNNIAVLTPDQFVDTILVSGLGTRFVAVGEDFRFGLGRSGDVHTLQQSGATRGFGVEIVPALKLGDEVVSSTRIKKAISESGDPAEAKKLLGRPWVLTGMVEKGDQLGRTIGFPTANLKRNEQVLPRLGVYAVFVKIEGLDVGQPDLKIAGVMNVGNRPTVGGDSTRIEVHLLDYSGLDLYGRTLRVEPAAYLRSEMKFPTLDALKEQIKLDCQQAQILLHVRS